MLRNEKTGRFESAKNVNVNDINKDDIKACGNCNKCDCKDEDFSKLNVNRDYGYYSKKLGRAFDTLRDLVNAEDEVARAEAAKKAAAEAKKADANKVEDAFKRLNTNKREYNEAVTKARKEYLEAVNAAKAKLDETTATFEKALATAQKAYDEALREFTKAHPEGFHLTLRDGDNVSKIAHSGGVDRADVFEDLFNLILKSF